MEDEGITQGGFRVTARKRPILKAGPIDQMTKDLGIAPPEMIFGENFLRIEHLKTGWGIEFNTYDALDRVDKTGGSMLKVAHSREWQENRQHMHSEIKEVIKPFDWSYTTDYKGTLLSHPSPHPEFAPSSTPLPLHLLTQQDPILYYTSLPLYEDELADNGTSSLALKLRVMPARLLLLARFFLRLDGVLLRIRDVRVYVEFATAEVVREWIWREAEFAAVRSALEARGVRGDAVHAALGNEDELCRRGVVPVVDEGRERVVLEGG